MSKNSGHKNIGNDELFNEFSRAAARACSPVSRYNLALSKINQHSLFICDSQGEAVQFASLSSVARNLLLVYTNSVAQMLLLLLLLCVHKILCPLQF